MSDVKNVDATESAKEVLKVPNTRKDLKIGKPRKILSSRMRSKVAFGGSGGGFGGGGFGGSGGGLGTVFGSGGNFYSPELSTDFLELPQSIDEQRNYYRFFYQTDPFVGQAIDLHVELPLSKLRLGQPKAKNRELAKKAMRFCEKWAKRIGLLHRLIEIVHDYHLLGEAFIFIEDTSPDLPDHIRLEEIRSINEETGEVIIRKEEREDADERTIKWMKKNYKGWTDIRVIPPEQIHMESFPLTKQKIIEFVPDAKSKDVVGKAAAGDPQAIEIAESMPQAAVEAMLEGRNLPLNTDPEAGSFVYYLARKKSQYEPRGHSILERCLRILVYRDKLRQSQTSIASRHMTPVRIVTAQDADVADIEELREQVDFALQDPDFSIITNYEVTWEEMGVNDRLLDLASEFDITDRQLYAGLGVTESLLSGESSYSGDRINLEVINTRYMLLRELIQDFVEEQLFKPMCARLGFIEEDEDGDEVVVYPSLSFTRLALRDNQDTFDALFNLYQKGSLDIDVILELLNIDPETTREKLEQYTMTYSDASFNEVLRGIYSRIGDDLAENTDAKLKIAELLGLEYTEPEEGGGRF